MSDSMDCMNKEKKIILMGLTKTCFTLITNRNYDGIDVYGGCMF